MPWAGLAIGSLPLAGILAAIPQCATGSLVTSASTGWPVSVRPLLPHDV